MYFGSRKKRVHARKKRVNARKKRVRAKDRKVLENGMRGYTRNFTSKNSF